MYIYALGILTGFTISAGLFSIYLYRRIRRQEKWMDKALGELDKIEERIERACLDCTCTYGMHKERHSICDSHGSS